MKIMFPQHLGQDIRIVALDVDGVLTDGIIHLDAQGEEHKRFHVSDGLGIRLLLEAGVHVGMISARSSPSVAFRARELSLSFVHQGVQGSKWECLHKELRQRGLEAAQCAAMGDDWVDLDILCRVGLATAPRDARAEVRQRVHWVAQASGGRGAVRELAEELLMAQGKWDAAVAGFLPGRARADSG
ncbi:MAG: phenylphosphate carboxylase subunit delta [Magnetococcales bacterium]|nr:phenylphosphate carboxylase subunit delta [Magnetococcales bacterium]